MLAADTVDRLSKLSDPTVEPDYADMALRMACAVTHRAYGGSRFRDMPLQAHISRLLKRTDEYDHLPVSEVEELAGKIAVSRQDADLRVDAVMSVSHDRVDSGRGQNRTLRIFAVPFHNAQNSAFADSEVSSDPAIASTFADSLNDLGSQLV